MTTATASAMIDAPSSLVWEVLNDHEGMHNWLPGMRVRVIKPGPQVPGGVGTVREVRLPGPFPPVVEEIVGHTPERRLSYVARSGMPLRNYAANVAVTPIGPQTRISYAVHCDQRVPGVDAVLAHLAARVLVRGLVRAVGTREG